MTRTLVTPATGIKHTESQSHDNLFRKVRFIWAYAGGVHTRSWVMVRLTRKNAFFVPSVGLSRLVNVRLFW